MFPGTMIPAPSQTLIELDNLEVIWLEFDGYKVESWYIPPSNSDHHNPHPLMIIAHGNAALIDYWLDQLNGLLDRGIGVLLVEYPGYGRSGGKPSQESIREAFVRAYDTIVERPDIDPSKVLLFGRSIGTGIVCDLSRYRSSCGMILLSGFISTRSFAGRYLLPGILARDPFDNIAALEDYSKPAVIIHAADDEVIPYDHSVRLHEAAKDGIFITLDSGGHNLCIRDWDDFWNSLDTFFEKTGVI